MNFKQLYIVRHGKSSWDYNNVSDIDRPLQLKGIKNAYEMANKLKTQNIIPELIISSPANRALHTAIIFARVLGYPLHKLSINQEIYGGGEDSILSKIRMTDNSINSLMIFGHNPDFTYLTNELCKTYISNIPTAGVVGIQFDTDSWKNIDKKHCSSEFFDYPKKE